MATAAARYAAHSHALTPRRPSQGLDPALLFRMLILSLAAIALLAIALGISFAPQARADDHPLKCRSVLVLMAAQGGSLDDMDEDRNRYADELAMAVRLGFVANGSSVDTEVRLTAKGWTEVQSGRRFPAAA